MAYALPGSRFHASCHNCRFATSKRPQNHDDARPDAPTQGLAQMEPGHRGPGVHRPLHSQLSAATAPPARQQRCGRLRGGARNHRRPVPPAYQQQMQAYRARTAATSTNSMLKQLGIDQRIVQQMIEEETGLAEAARLGIASSDEEVRAADRCHAGLPGKRPVHRRAAISPAPADAEPADDARRVRGTDSPERRRSTSFTPR